MFSGVIKLTLSKVIIASLLGYLEPYSLNRTWVWFFLISDKSTSGSLSIRYFSACNLMAIARQILFSSAISSESSSEIESAVSIIKLIIFQKMI